MWSGGGQRALALSTGCPHGPQGSRRPEGLVHKSSAQGAGVARAPRLGEVLQPFDYSSSLPAGRPRSPGPNRSWRSTRTDPCGIRRSRHRRLTPPGPGIGRRHALPPASARQTLNADVVRCSSSPTRRSRRGCSRAKVVRNSGQKSCGIAGKKNGSL